MLANYVRLKGTVTKYKILLMAMTAHLAGMTANLFRVRYHFYPTVLTYLYNVRINNEINQIKQPRRIAIHVPTRTIIPK